MGRSNLLLGQLLYILHLLENEMVLRHPWLLSVLNPSLHVFTGLYNTGQR